MLTAGEDPVRRWVRTWGYNKGLDRPLLGGSQVSKARPGAPFACFRRREVTDRFAGLRQQIDHQPIEWFPTWMGHRPIHWFPTEIDHQPIGWFPTWMGHRFGCLRRLNCRAEWAVGALVLPAEHLRRFRHLHCPGIAAAPGTVRVMLLTADWASVVMARAKHRADGAGWLDRGARSGHRGSVGCRNGLSDAAGRRC
jgi:hypothetical protein